MLTMDSKNNRNNNNFYLFEFQNKYFYYDFSQNLILQVTEKLFTIIDKYIKDQCLVQDELVYIESLQKNGLLQYMSQAKSANSTIMSDIAYLSFAPTYNCNFKCSYCFGECGNYFKGNEKSFSHKSLKNMLDCFFYKIFPDAKHYRIDFVSGGEPLLGYPIIKETINYCENFEAITGKKVSIWMCTNASLITDEIIEFLSHHSVSIGISIDGDKSTNDANRKFADGRGTYDEIVKGIELIKNNGNVSRKFKSIWGLCTATNENCDIVNILTHLKSLGFESVQIRLIRSCEHYEIKKLTNEYERLSQFLLSKYRNGDLSFLRMILNDNDQFGKILKRIILGNTICKRCDAGINKITICPDGTIYPCDSLVGISECLIGTLENPVLKNEFFKETSVDSIPKCKDCDIKHLCGGDCYYNSLKKSNNIQVPDNEYCQLQRFLLHLSLVLFMDFQLSNEKLLKTLTKEIIIKEEYHELYG